MSLARSGTAVPLHLQLALGSATYHSETRRKYVGSAQATAKSWSVALRSKLALFRLRSTHTPAAGLAIMPAAAATRPSEYYKDATSMKDEASLLEGLITYVDIREPNWRWKQLPYWSVALFIYQFMWPEHRAATFEWDWMLFILVRNLAIMLIWYGGWHHFLYVKRSLPIETKFNSKYPPESQHYRDAFWTTVGFAIGSAVEIGFCHLWATNKLPRLEPLESPLAFLALIPFQAFYADFHFYFIHRWLHFPGLYKYVHSLHHKSYNTGVWSGFAMHPVEQMVYLTRAFLPLLFAHHPIHFIYMVNRAMLSPVTSHHGFSAPGGSLSHYIHHAKFNCNYGAGDNLPFDKWFGTRVAAL